MTFRYTGLRPGEKLSESLFSEHEQSLPTDHPRIFRSTSEHRVVGLHQKLRSLYDSASRNDAEATRAYLRSMLPDYHPLVPTRALRGRRPVRGRLLSRRRASAAPTPTTRREEHWA